MDLIELAKEEIIKGIDWAKSTATAIWHAIEPMWIAAAQTFEQLVIHDLLGAGAAFVQKLVAMGRNLSLPDIESAFLMAVEHFGGPLLAAAQALGSNLLQSSLGLLHIQAGGATAPA